MATTSTITFSILLSSSEARKYFPHAGRQMLQYSLNDDGISEALIHFLLHNLVTMFYTPYLVQF